jgi:hypothetical protein
MLPVPATPFRVGPRLEISAPIREIDPDDRPAEECFVEARILIPANSRNAWLWSDRSWREADI